MSRWSGIARTGGLLPMGFAASAMAQPVPQLEIDFVSATLPLSPLLTLLIAVTVGTLGIYALRRAHARTGPAATMVVALAAGALAALVTQWQPISDATAKLVTQPLPLTVSPAIVTVALGGYQAINATGANITLTAVRLDNPQGGEFVETPPTTCTVGLTLAPGASCIVFVNLPV